MPVSRLGRDQLVRKGRISPPRCRTGCHSDRQLGGSPRAVTIRPVRPAVVTGEHRSLWIGRRNTIAAMIFPPILRAPGTVIADGGHRGSHGFPASGRKGKRVRHSGPTR